MTGLLLRSSSTKAKALQRCHRYGRVSYHRISSSTSISNNLTAQRQFNHLMLATPTKTATTTSTTTRQIASRNLRSQNVITTKRADLSSDATASNKPPPSDDPTMKNVALAAALFGFVASVFFYSLNAVGRGEEIEGGELDPLATLKAEAQEAREMEKYKNQGKRMTQEEIHELETGRSGADDSELLEAALEEEANRKVFGGADDGDNDSNKKTKKPWWRFGF